MCDMTFMTLACFIIFSSFPGPSSHFSTFHQLPVRKVLPTKSQWWWHVQQSAIAALSFIPRGQIGHRGLHPACHLVSFGLLVFWKLLAPSLLRGPMSPHSTSSYVKPSGLVEQTLPLDPFEKVKPLEKRGYNLQKQSNGWKPFEGRVDAFLKSLLTPLTAVFLWSQWHMGCCSET